MAARERYVLLGLARARAEWFRRVGQWSTSAALPAEFVKCVSAEELRVRLRSGRPFSAAILDAALTRVDRDLLAELREAGVVPLVVDDGRAARDWVELGAVAVLPPTLTREVLLDALATHATMVGIESDRAADGEASLVLPGELGRLVAVLGPGGTGTSTAAIALAQGLAAGPHAPDVVLVDGCLHAEQAMLHDSREVVPGLQELVDAHRGTTPDLGTVRAQTFDIERRGYHLLLGLRRARFWTSVRRRAFEASLRSLRSGFDMVVADVDANLEGESEGGSIDVEERHVVARTAVGTADVVFVVGRPGLKGVYSLVRVLDEVLAFGVPASRVVPVISHAPRSPKQRAELARAVADLVAGGGASALPSPVFLPRRKVDEALRDGTRLPEPLPTVLAGACAAALGRSGSGRTILDPEPAYERVAPGSLGTWTAHDPHDPPPPPPGDTSAPGDAT
ncbi:MAG TPA: hypothetical protein VGA36_01710 [Nitriliruptorales bacterium]